MATSTKIVVHIWWTPLMTFHFGSGEFEIHNGDSTKPSIIQIENFKDHIQELKFKIKRENRGFFNNIEIKFITSKTDILIQFDDDDALKACEIFSNVYKIVGPIIDSNKIIIKTET